MPDALSMRDVMQPWAQAVDGLELVTNRDGCILWCSDWLRLSEIIRSKTDPRFTEIYHPGEWGGEATHYFKEENHA